MSGGGKQNIMRWFAQQFFREPNAAAATVNQEEAITEMEMLKELRNVVASTAGQAGGNREAVKAEILAELVSTIKERFGANLDQVKP